MSNEINMTIGVSIVLNKVLTSIIFIDPNPEKPSERILPLSIKYKLQRAKNMVEKDCIYFENEKAKVIKDLGEEKGGDISIPKEKEEEYKSRLLSILQTEVAHNFIKLKPADVSDINVEGISTEEVSLFMATLIEDEDLEKDLNTPVSSKKEDENK